ncbi:MAG: hypothetical protein JWO86_7073 [Myxococcaceae bacterium]|nr:hypothetical protein [Myxococcaceae bacterium]
MPSPPKPKGKPDDLAEVERALSVLQGRHPEHERARRQDDEARARRSAQLDTQARVETTKNRSRYIRLGAIAVPVVALIGFVGMLATREMGRRGRVEQVGEPFRAFGFATVDTSAPASAGSLEATVEPGCFLALATGAAPIRLTRAAGAAEAPSASPLLFCTCASEHIGLKADVPAGGGVLLMRADAATIGGSRAFAFAPFKPASTLRTDDACSDASLDAWIDAKRYPAAAPSGPWLASWPHRAALTAAGFRTTVDAPPGLPFVVVDVPKESCLLATSSVAGDKLGLRMKGGTMALSDVGGTVARCAQADGTMLVAREGKGELVVMIAPAATLGGMHGLREVARENGIVVAAANVPAADHAWDAKQVLLASQIPEATIKTDTAPDVAPDPEARVAALSFDSANALVAETPENTYSYCDPPLDATMREATCVFSGAQKWRTEAGAEAVGGMARAKLPFWLFAMQTASDPNALKGMTQLFALARRLGRDSFTPTTLEALTELPNGVEVLGRKGEDAIVAVGVAPTEPFVYPLTDGPAWTLDGAPRVVATRPLERVMLLAPQLKNLPPKASRRTVVFRRQKPDPNH